MSQSVADGDSNEKEKKKELGSVSGVDDEFSLSGCSLFISHS